MALTWVLLIASGGIVASTSAFGEPTAITVRVIAKDAKFIGTSMGGMRVKLWDAQTGELLAQGVTEGGTGNTKRIMHKDRGRRALFANESAAKFETTLDLKGPRLIKAEAYGPLAQPQAAHRVASTQWVVPGQDLSPGDGWILELPGFVVKILEPRAHAKLASGTQQVALRSNVAMMCGCPIKPNGIWDAKDYEIKAILRRDGQRLQAVDLTYAGQPSQFASQVAIPGPGTYEVLVYAYDPHNGNTGIDRTSFTIQNQ